MINKSLFLTEEISSQPKRSSTRMLMRESAKRFPTYYFQPNELYMENGKAFALAHKVTFDKECEVTSSQKPVVMDLSENCLITLRMDPPFDMAYYSALTMLRNIGKRSYITNNPASIINMPEKFIPHELKKFTPPTLFSGNFEQIKKFYEKHKDIIIKPLYDFGGQGVFHVSEGDDNLKSVFHLLATKTREPVIVQKFIPAIKKGDKRIALVDGEILGQLMRIPPKGQIQAAVMQGGDYTKIPLTAKEKEICKILKPILKKNDIFFCGIDIIGDYITEVNVTCPAFFYYDNELRKNDKNFVPSEQTYWNILENKLKALHLL